MKRGDVWWARCDIAFEDHLWNGGRRPVVVLSAGDPVDVRAMWIVAAAGVDIAGVALELPLGPEEGVVRGAALRVAVPRPPRILCDWLTIIPRSELVAQAGALSAEKLLQLEEILRRGELDPARWAD